MLNSSRSFTQSESLFLMAQKDIPGGVNSPVRAFKSVNRNPIYIERGAGSKIYDVDGNEYVDFCGSWGPLILGHARKEIVDAVKKVIENGLTFGACIPSEIHMATQLKQMSPNLEKVRLVTSGTEATMTALRLARAYTKRDKVIKFQGCYHGHADAFLIDAGSGLLTAGIPSSLGVTQGVAQDTICLPFNNLTLLEQVFEENKSQISCIIVEPVPGNMGLVLPEPNYLQSLIEIAHKHGSLVIFDEVICGFRMGASTYAHLHGLDADLITLGKIIGGGMPMGAVGGKRTIMDQLAPLGGVYQAGTLSGNPLAIVAGLTTLELLEKENPYPLLAEKSDKIARRLNELLRNLKIPGQAINSGALFTLFFTTQTTPLKNLNDVKMCHTDHFSRYFSGMLERGFYLPPSQFEAVFLSVAHTQEDLENFLIAAQESLKQISLNP